MCRFSNTNNISVNDIPEYLINLALEDISDEDLQANEEMWESDEESSNDDSSLLEMHNLFKPNMLRMNINYNLNLYDDLLVSDLHLTAMLFKFDDGLGFDRYICQVCFSANLSLEYNASNVKNYHILCTPDQFSNNVNVDLNYTTNEYFCYSCDKFLWNVTEYIPICCEQVHNDYFKTEQCNFYFTDL